MEGGVAAPALPGFLNETNQPSSRIQELELKMKMLQWRKGENDAKIKDTIVRVNRLQEELSLPRMALEESQVRVKWQRQVLADEAQQPLRAGYSQMRDQEQTRSRHQQRIKKDAKKHAVASRGNQLPPNCKQRYNMKGLHRDMKKVYAQQVLQQQPNKGGYRGQELLQRSIADLPTSIDHSRRQNAI
jgi:hypothetical protein